MQKFLKIFGIVLVILVVTLIIFVFNIWRKANDIMDTEKSLNVTTGAGILNVGIQSPGNTVVISSVTLFEPGFVVIETIGRVSEIIGTSQLLPVGTQKNLRIYLGRDVKGIKLSGSLWKDNGDGIFNTKLDEWVKNEKTGLRVFQYFDVFDVKTQSTVSEKQENINDTNTKKVNSANIPILRSISEAEYLKYKNKNQKNEEEKHDFFDEIYFLSKYPEVIRINKNCLEININNGTKKNICDIINDEPSSISYQFSGRIPNFGYWFYVGYYEGSSGLLVDENTGKEIRTFDERPIVSPNGKQFLTTSTDIEAHYNKSGFQVMEKKGDEYILKAEYIVDDHPTNVDWGVSDALWINDNSFYFVKNIFDINNPIADQIFRNEYAEFSF